MCRFTRRLPTNPRLDAMRRAIAAHDGEAVEGLRDHVDAAAIAALVADWSPQRPWPEKDTLVALLMDRPVQKHPALRPIMEDALRSPTVETRAYGLCCLTGDWDAFNQWLDGGWVQEDRVDAAIRAYRGG